jgi:hypothetical protein
MYLYLSKLDLKTNLSDEGVSHYNGSFISTTVLPTTSFNARMRDPS